MATAVIGAGIMGLLCARSLLEQGEEVILFEPAQKREGQASWAGGGMGMPLYPWRMPEAISLLVKRAYQLYPALSCALMEETGIDVQWQSSGLLIREKEEQHLALAWAQKYQFPLQLREEGIWMPTVCQVRNPRLLKALRSSINQFGDSLKIVNAFVLALNKKDNLTIEVKTQEENFICSKVVLAAGAWTANLLKTLHIKLDIFPMRGQMLLWKASKNVLPYMLLSAGKYLIPREDGHILAGSSMENVGFDSSTTKEQYQELKTFAETLLPALQDYPVIEHWAGLRPAISSDIPIIGKVPGFDNLWLNTGHYRNGILLAPAANELLMDLMQEKNASVPARLYAYEGTHYA